MQPAALTQQWNFSWDTHYKVSSDTVYAHLNQLPMRLLKEGIERLRYEEVVKALEKPS
jgi:hypothetical protein